jgi:hypothetical protein
MKAQLAAVVSFFNPDTAPAGRGVLAKHLWAVLSVRPADERLLRRNVREPFDDPPHNISAAIIGESATILAFGQPP